MVLRILQLNRQLSSQAVPASSLWDVLVWVTQGVLVRSLRQVWVSASVWQVTYIRLHVGAARGVLLDVSRDTRMCRS